MRDTPYPSAARAWYGVGVLMVAYTFSFIDRYVIALLVNPIKRDLEIGDFQFGLLSGLAFAVFYTSLGIPIGRLADRHSRRSIISVGIAIWSLMTALCGLARGYWQLFAARIGVGVGEAALSPAAYSLISDSFPPSRIGRALAVYSAGVYIGSGLAFIIGGAVIQMVASAPDVAVPLLGTFRPWQLVFVIVGLPGLAIAAWVLTLREPERRNRASLAAAPPSIADVIAFARRAGRAYGAHFAGFGLLALIFNAVVIWSPALMTRVFGMSTSDAGYSIGLIIVVFGSAGIICGGWLSDRLAARGASDATLRVGIISALGVAPLAIAIPFMSSAGSFLVLYAPLIFFCSFGFGAAAAAIQLITPNEMRGQLSAVYLFVINLVGIGLGPPLTGALTDWLFADPLAVGFSIALVAGIAAPTAALTLWWGLPAYRRQYAYISDLS